MFNTQDTELRIPTHLALMACASLALILGFVERTDSAPFVLIETSLLLLVLAGLTLVASLTRPKAAPWLLVAGLQGLLGWLMIEHESPHLVVMIPFLVGLAGGLVGASGSAFVASVPSVALLMGLDVLASDRALSITALASSWAMVLLMIAVYLPVRSVRRGAQEYLSRAQKMVEHATGRQAELAQALDDLAHLNRQLILTTKKLDDARRVAETLQKVKVDFVARVSHELRTPLNMIVGFAEMIAEAPTAYGGSVPQALLADLAVILRNSRHLASLIDDVLDLSRIDAGQMAITRERTSIPAIVEAAVGVVRPLFQSKGLFLRDRVPDDLPLVFCDPTRIREALVNLLSNAGRFTDEGGVEIAVHQQGTSVILAVTDTGPGIDPEQSEQLFQPFHQLEDIMRRRHGGTGLGLAISKSFVELHGGRMWFESELARGTTFYFRLPIDPPTAVDGSAARWLEPTWEYKARLTRPSLPQADLYRRLMILEEGTSLTRLLTRYVDGVELVQADSLQHACELAVVEPVQAVVINALSVGEALSGVASSALGSLDMPIIVCSVPEISETTDRLGVSDYLLKPVTREQLCTALDGLGRVVRKVLVVDDEPQELRMFWRMLVSAGRDYRVLTATDGEEALRIMRCEAPDAVLLDLVMPKMDGFQLLQQRSRDPKLRCIPVVLVTALDPSAQPIVSSAVAVTKGTGLAVQPFLACIEGLSHLFGAVRAPYPVQQEGPSA